MKLRKLTAILAAMILVLSCVSVAAAEEVPTLVISTWPANIDTITENVFKPFEEANNCKIVVETGNNSQRLAKLMEEAFCEEKDTKSLIQIKGLGCGCCS